MKYVTFGALSEKSKAVECEGRSKPKVFCEVAAKAVSQPELIRMPSLGAAVSNAQLCRAGNRHGIRGTLARSKSPKTLVFSSR